MASVPSPSDKANGIVGKRTSKEPKPDAGPDAVDVEDEEEVGREEDEEDEDDLYEDADDEDERQVVGDDEEDEGDQGEEGEGQDKPQSLTHFLLDDPEGDNDEDEFDEEEPEDVYIPPAPEPISRKRSHQEVAEDDEEPDSKKAKA